MALSKLFERIFWHNNTTPAINEDNLNAMSKAIDDIDDRVILLGADVLEVVPELQEMTDELEEMVANPPYIGANGNWYVWNIEQGAYVDSGIDASITLTIQDVTMLAYGATPYVTNSGTNTDPIFHLFIPRAAGISNVAKTGTSGLVDTYTITFEDGTTKTFTVTNGKGILTISKTGTSGLVDTYTITYNDGTTSSFTITNGATPIVDQVYDSTSANPQSGVAVAEAISGKQNNLTPGENIDITSDTISVKDVITALKISNAGNASSSNVGYKALGYKKNGIDYTLGLNGVLTGSMYMSQSVTLSTSGEVTATFTNNNILADSVVDVYTSDPNITYKSMNISAGTCTVTFDAQAIASTITVRIYIK